MSETSSNDAQGQPAADPPASRLAESEPAPRATPDAPGAPKAQVPASDIDTSARDAVGPTPTEPHFEAPAPAPSAPPEPNSEGSSPEEPTSAAAIETPESSSSGAEGAGVESEGPKPEPDAEPSADSEAEPSAEAPPEPDPSPLIVVEGLSLGGAGGRPPLRLARWELRQGVTGLVGPSGVGKTALCEVLLGLGRARGQVQVLGHALPKAGSRVRAEVGYLAQDLAVYPGMTALEFATFVGEAHARWRGKKVFERLARYQVPTRIPVEQIAPRARAFLAMALALGSDPKLVIVDLPTCLDGGARADLLEALLAERGETSLLISTARPHELEGRCREVLILGGGSGEVVAGQDVARGLWRLDLTGDARPPLDPALTCLQAGPGPSGARWIVSGDEALLPRDPAQVSSLRPASYEEAALARIAALQSAPAR